MRVQGVNKQHGLTLLELTVVLMVLLALAGLAVPYVGNVGRTAMCQTTDATMQAVKEAIMGGNGGLGFYEDTLGFYPKNKKNSDYDYNLKYLFTAPTDASWGTMSTFNAKTSVGWRGPYLSSGANISTLNLDGSFEDLTTHVHVKLDPTDVNVGSQVLDAWGRPIILQVPNEASCDSITGRTAGSSKYGECARLVSAGPGFGIGSNEAAIDSLINDDDTTTVIENKRGFDDRILYLKIPTPLKDSINVSCDAS